MAQNGYAKWYNGINIVAKLCCLLVITSTILAYEVPEVRFEVLKPKGFRASIPDTPGIGLFSFNGNINQAITKQTVGDVTGEVFEPTAGRWVFTDSETALQSGDTIHYWVMVSVDRLGYLKDNLSFEYDGKAAVTSTATSRPDGGGGGGGGTTDACADSATTVRGRPACAGKLIFQDTFDRPSSDWQFEQKIPSAHPEYPFVSYHNRAQTITVSEGKLRITPSLLQTLPPYSIESIRAGTLDLFRGCTDSAETCSMTASGSDILPPAVTGRASTKYSFTFRYGVVEIRARLPKGDWLYPELLLEPFMSKYGREHFSSGVVKVAFSRGNQELRKGQDQIGNTKLYGGAILDRFLCHDSLLFWKESQRSWSEDFHTYSVRWEPERMIWSVDGVEYGRFETPPGGLKEKLKDCPGMSTVFQRWGLGTKMAPFDEEFYLTVGLAAGGITEFPDNSVTTLGRIKPWLNLSSKAKLHFWQDIDNWYGSWNQNSVLEIDSVKVTAL